MRSAVVIILHKCNVTSIIILKKFVWHSGLTTMMNANKTRKFTAVAVCSAILWPSVLSLSTNAGRSRVRRIYQTNSLASSATSLEVPTSTCISLPAIHWTVPGYKVGWRDSDGNWFDEDGPRNGPPQNFWRQAADEREYKIDIDAVNSVLSNSSAENIEVIVKALEYRCSVRKPWLSRRLLGSWAPLLRCGVCVAQKNIESIEAPFTVDVFRTNGRKLAPKTPYGQFESALEVGEDITVETSNLISKTMSVKDNNEPVILGMLDDMPFCLGSISYITDYVLIQRNPEGAIDFWLRCDDSYQGVKEEVNKEA